MQCFHYIFPRLCSLLPSPRGTFWDGLGLTEKSKQGGQGETKVASRERKKGEKIQSCVVECSVFVYLCVHTVQYKKQEKQVVVCLFVVV